MAHQLRQPNAEARSRLERLLRGERRTDDLDRLFFLLRERTYGVVSVKQLANMAAHPVETDRGPLAEEIKRYFDLLYFHMFFWGQTVDMQHVHNEFPNLIKSGFSYLSEKEVQARAGLGLKQAKAVVEGLAKKFRPNAKGGLHLSELINRKEEALLECCINTVRERPKPVFSASDLHRDLQFVLRKNGILLPEEQAGFAKLHDFISLFAVCKMHKLVIKFHDGKSSVFPHGTRFAELKGGIRSGNIIITADVPFDGGINPLKMSTPWFVTGLSSLVYCDPPISEDGQWEHPIEITSEEKIVEIK